MLLSDFPGPTLCTQHVASLYLSICYLYVQGNISAKKDKQPEVKGRHDSTQSPLGSQPTMETLRPIFPHFQVVVSVTGDKKEVLSIAENSDPDQVEQKQEKKSQGVASVSSEEYQAPDFYFPLISDTHFFHLAAVLKPVSAHR